MNPNGAETTKGSSSHTTSNTPAAVLVGSVIGGIVVIVFVIGASFFVQRRRRRRRSVFSDSMEHVSIPFGSAQGSGAVAGQQPLVFEGPEAEMVALRGLPSTPHAVLSHSRPVAPVPVGLSGKDLARLRTEALSSEQFHNPATSNVPHSTSSNTVHESGGAASSYDPQRLQSEFDSLWREMERLRTSGLAPGAPPSYYTEGDG